RIGVRRGPLRITVEVLPLGAGVQKEAAPARAELGRLAGGRPIENQIDEAVSVQIAEREKEILARCERRRDARITSTVEWRPYLRERSRVAGRVRRGMEESIREAKSGIGRGERLDFF